MLSLGYFGVKRTRANPRKKSVKCSYLLLCLTMGTPPERSWFAPNQSSQLLSAQQSNLHRAAWAQKKKKKNSPKITKKTQSNFQHVFLLPSLIGFLNSQWKFPSRWKNQSNSRGGFQDPEFHGLLRRCSKFDRFFKFPMKILTRNPIPDFDWVFMVLL